MNITQVIKINRYDMDPIPVLEKLLYSSDLAVCNVFMLQKPKIAFEKISESLEDIQSTVMTVIKKCLQNDFQQCFQACQKCLNWYIKQKVPH
jgi:hypothetical protein